LRVFTIRMNDNEKRAHIKAASRGTAPASVALTSRIVAACWPGGSSDRTERAALVWLRHWRPERCGVQLPACSCASQRCLVCN
jgi:hypothetical protein